jgi:hypothetical protein
MDEETLMAPDIEGKIFGITIGLSIFAIKVERCVDLLVGGTCRSRVLNDP